MERGFDKLMTPEGISLVIALMFFTLFFIVLGANIVRHLERRRKVEKQRRQDE